MSWAWTALILGFAGLFAYLKIQRFWVEHFSPDCKQYTDLAVDGKAVAPYCYRPLIPWLARQLALWHDEDIEACADWLKRFCVAGIALLPLCTGWLALELGASPAAAACAVLVVIATDALFGLALSMPWLLDPPALCLALVVCACQLHGWELVAAVLLALLAITKESAFIFAGVFLLFGPAPFSWQILTGLAAGALLQGVVRYLARPLPTEAEELLHPWRWATVRKAPVWGLYAWNLGALEATPWVAAVWLPGSPWALSCVLVGVLAWAQTLVATDTGRLVAFWMPWGAACVSAVAPPWGLALWVLLSVGWPLKHQDILTPRR